MDQPTLEYRARSSAPRPQRRTLAHASLVIVVVADCLAGAGYSAAILPRGVGTSFIVEIVAASLGFVAVAAWFVAVAFAWVSLVDRDGPRRLALLALLIAMLSVSGTFLLGSLLERSRL